MIDYIVLPIRYALSLIPADTFIYIALFISLVVVVVHGR